MFYKKEVIQRRKESGICIHCGSRPTFGSYATCEVCLAKNREYAKKNRINNIEYQKKLREKLKSAGLCIRCGKHKTETGFSQCRECRGRDRPTIHSEEALKRQKEKAKLRYAERKNQGICVRCGKEKALPGIVLCSICRINRNQAIYGYFEHDPKWYKKEREAGRI